VGCEIIKIKVSDDAEQIKIEMRVVDETIQIENKNAPSLHTKNNVITRPDIKYEICDWISESVSNGDIDTTDAILVLSDVVCECYEIEK